MENEYSITASELRTIVDLVASGYECVQMDNADVLYCVLKKGEDFKEFELTQC